MINLNLLSFVLMLAGIKDILIIVNKGQLHQFRKVLSDGIDLVSK